jgi:hypothetical protein
MVSRAAFGRFLSPCVHLLRYCVRQMPREIRPVLLTVVCGVLQKVIELSGELVLFPQDGL